MAGESTDLITFASKGEMLAKSKQFWNPGKTQFWMDSGVPLVIDRREGYFEVLRVAVNVGNSLGGSGIETSLAPSMTVGTGFFGRSSASENLQPKHLVQWTRIAYNADPTEPFGNFSGIIPWQSPAGQVPPYPHASNLAEPAATAAPALREQIRRLVAEELAGVLNGAGG